ncbi:hypothetical protein F9B85_10040 [Heliorestis acidaminivorans]|uniref:Uncharacterized protein n=1 Tax=Heliorestis acidaminivorans TaxID=553427 RepID=A0A6I0EY15_9FIRM|nr:hypothetical protein [Heliorestis acidaminivorans]KAB2952143.1 hypothetical protein F9B85_10040 [Heliorestis acidaminivorans]
MIQRVESISWGRVNIDPPPFDLTDRDKKLIKTLETTHYLTAWQIAQLFWQGNIDNAKSRLKKLTKKSQIKKNWLRTGDPLPVAFYSANSTPAVPELQVLKIMTGNMIYVRLPEEVRESCSWITRNAKPFTASFTMDNEEHYVVVARNYPMEIYNIAFELRWVGDKKILFIVPDVDMLSQAKETLKPLELNIQFFLEYKLLEFLKNI